MIRMDELIKTAVAKQDEVMTKLFGTRERDGRPKIDDLKVECVGAGLAAAIDMLARGHEAVGWRYQIKGEYGWSGWATAGTELINELLAYQREQPDSIRLQAMHVFAVTCDACGGRGTIRAGAAGSNEAQEICGACGGHGTLVADWSHSIVETNNRLREEIAASRKKAIEDVVAALTGHELYKFRPKAFEGFIEFARENLAGDAR